MAENPFTIEDVERILRAVFPDLKEENPLGVIQARLLDIMEDIDDMRSDDALDRRSRDEQLDKIQSRTFGILILQIINIIRIMMGLLPAGRVVLMVIAGTGLITTFLQSGKVSGEDIRNAIEQSGLSEFISNQLKKLRELADGVADDIDTTIDLGASVVEAAALRAQTNLIDLQFLANELAEASQLNDPQEIIARMERVTAETIGRATELTNLTSNLDSLIIGSLRTLPQQVRAIPNEAAKLIS